MTAQLRTRLEALVKLSHALGAGCEVPAEGQPLVWRRNVAGHAGPLSVRSYEARLKEWAVHAQLDPRISPHWLRHTGHEHHAAQPGQQPLEGGADCAEPQQPEEHLRHLPGHEPRGVRARAAAGGRRAVAQEVARQMAVGVAA